MRETSKCYALRKARGDFDNFLRGKGIDIGCGPDPLKVENGTVRPWDIPDGDAQIMPGVPDGELDFIYSSHCLEHMRDVPTTLHHWARIVKPGGFLYFVVPEYVLYEKMTWPSMFNSDHKQSFSPIISRRHVQRPNHYHTSEDMIPLMTSLGLENVRITMEDMGFNYNAGILDQTLQHAVAQLCFVAKKK
ncbi:MAG TPA: class I SAM-dependent methyltransferase [Tepidisphaeraceae bacterium]|jgi:ubiquinone/menaquinone biosynthesis C-methylase UbiE